MKHALLSFMFVASAFFAKAQIPTISSLSTYTATVGTTVAINGSNFNTITSNNAIYFGPVRAAVSSATE